MCVHNDSCDDRYLQYGDVCVHQDVTIGVASGVGGAIILALIIALIVVSTRKSKRKHRTYDESIRYLWPYKQWYLVNGKLTTVIILIYACIPHDHNTFCLFNKQNF